MVYTKKCVLSVLLGGKFLPELANGQVNLPFGSEYQLRARNKHNRRCAVKFFIDDENVSGNGYVIAANSYIDIERHADTPTRFKFVSLESGEAIDFGKNGPNTDRAKGVIEARFYLEKEPVYTPVHQVYGSPWQPNPYWGGGMFRARSMVSSNGMPSINSSNSSADEAPMNSMGISDAACETACGTAQLTPRFLSFAPRRETGAAPVTRTAALKDGCTVEGGHSTQCFSATTIDLEEDYVSLKVFLQGYDPINDERFVTATAAHTPTITHLPSGVGTTAPRTSADIERENRDLAARVKELARQKAAREENERLKAELEALAQ